MSEPQVKPVVKVAQDLTEIESLHAALMVQAIHKASARIDGTSLPGGDAMVALGNVGSPAEWAELIAAAEFQHLAACPKLDHTRCRYAEHASDEDGSEPILQTLLFWSEAWRQEHGYPLDARRPSVVTEVRFIRWALEWAWSTLPEWDDFAKDVESARTRLENLLLAGERAERGAPCMYEACRGGRLVRKIVPKRGPDGNKVWEFSDWHCPRCKRTWDEKRYASMVTAAHEATKFEDIDGEVWCSMDYAARRVDRSAKTIETWANRGELSVVCLVAGRRARFVNLGEVVTLDDEKPRRKRAA